MLAEIANRFAKALDAEDYQAAAILLSDRCEYLCRGRTYIGPEAIIESYRTNGDTGKQSFERIEYESSVSVQTDFAATIHFADHLSHKGHQLTVRSEQQVQIDSGGQIVHIQHVDLPGQLEALKAFKQQY